MIDKEYLIALITKARISLEQGGKYDWNEILEECDDFLHLALEHLEYCQEEN